MWRRSLIPASGCFKSKVTNRISVFVVVGVGVGVAAAAAAAADFKGNSCDIRLCSKAPTFYVAVTSPTPTALSTLQHHLLR